MAYAYKLRLKTFNVVCEDEVTLNDIEKVSTPRTAAKVLRALFKASNLDESNENFVVLCLNARGTVVGFKLIAVGMQTACLVDSAMVMRAALILGGSSLIVCHNHPSGNLDPSKEDRELTTKLRRAAKDLSLTLADHIILAKEDFYSFRVEERWGTYDNE